MQGCKFNDLASDPGTRLQCAAVTSPRGRLHFRQLSGMSYILIFNRMSRLVAVLPIPWMEVAKLKMVQTVVLPSMIFASSSSSGACWANCQHVPFSDGPSRDASRRLWTPP